MKVWVFFSPLLFHIWMNIVFICFCTFFSAVCSTWCDCGSSKSSQFCPLWLWQLATQLRVFALSSQLLSSSPSCLSLSNQSQHVRVTSLDDTTRWKFTLLIPHFLAADTDSGEKKHHIISVKQFRKHQKPVQHPLNQKNTIQISSTNHLFTHFLFYLRCDCNTHSLKYLNAVFQSQPLGCSLSRHWQLEKWIKVWGEFSTLVSPENHTFGHVSCLITHLLGQ